RINSPGILLNAAHLIKLFKCRYARLVCHEVLSVSHDTNAKWRTFDGDRCADDELDRLILQDLVFGSREPGIWISFSKSFDQLGLLSEERHQLATAANHCFALPIDVSMIEANRRKSNKWCGDVLAR